MAGFAESSNFAPVKLLDISKRENPYLRKDPLWISRNGIGAIPGGLLSFVGKHPYLRGPERNLSCDELGP